MSIWFAGQVHAAGACRIEGPHPFESSKPCPDVVRYYLEDVSRCNILAATPVDGDTDALPVALEMWARDCHHLVQANEAIMAAYEEDQSVTGVVEEFFNTHQLKIQFERNELVEKPVNCSVVGAFAFQTQVVCPARVQYYLQRLSHCRGLEQQAAKGKHQAVVESKRQELLCDQLDLNYHAIMAEYDGDAPYAQLIDLYFTTHDIPYPSE